MIFLRINIVKYSEFKINILSFKLPLILAKKRGGEGKPCFNLGSPYLYKCNDNFVILLLN